MVAAVMWTDQRTLTDPAAFHDPAPFGYSHAASAPANLSSSRASTPPTRPAPPFPATSPLRWTRRSTG